MASSATCCRVAIVDTRIPRPHSRLPASTQRAAPSDLSCACSTAAVNTQKAACSDGQALPVTSTLFMNASDGYSAQSMPKSGTLVGQSMNAARPTALIASEATPYRSEERRVGTEGKRRWALGDD